MTGATRETGTPGADTSGDRDRRRGPSVDRWAAVVLGLLAVGVAVEAVSELEAGPRPLVNDWLHDGLILGSAVMCFVGAGRHAGGRRAWTCIAAGVFCLGLGEVLWGLLYLGVEADAIPYPNPASVFWLASYPLFMTGIVLVVRRRVSHFELHRWLDGLVVVLIVATPTVALVLEPVLREAPSDPFGQIVALSYPLGDLVLIGALLGAVPLMSWRVDAGWWWLGIGLLCMSVGDAVYAVGAISATYHEGPYDFLWSAGSVAIAVAAWRRTADFLPGFEPAGWPAVVLPLGAQVFALATQIYAYFHELPRIERLLTAVVLGIGIAQVIASRPRGDRAGLPSGDAEGDAEGASATRGHGP